MTSPDKKRPSQGRTAAAVRTERLAEELRSNLRKRKEKSRSGPANQGSATASTLPGEQPKD
jgi:hypothetical protein